MGEGTGRRTMVRWITKFAKIEKKKNNNNNNDDVHVMTFIATSKLNALMCDIYTFVFLPTLCI
jgi:hypothetical protein